LTELLRLELSSASNWPDKHSRKTIL